MQEGRKIGSFPLGLSLGAKDDKFSGVGWPGPYKRECGKVKMTEEQAKQELVIARKKAAIGVQHRKEIRYYYCKRCEAFHLTSRLPREGEEAFGP